MPVTTPADQGSFMSKPQSTSVSTSSSSISETTGITSSTVCTPDDDHVTTITDNKPDAKAALDTGETDL